MALASRGATALLLAVAMAACSPKQEQEPKAEPNPPSAKANTSAKPDTSRPVASGNTPTAADIAALALDPVAVEAAGSSLGSGGMIVVAEGTCMVRLLQVMLRFYHHESCGQCTPCREGMGWLHRIIDRIVAGEGRPEDLDRMVAISRLNDGTTICGMGDAAGYATVGILAKYRDEFDYWIEHKRSRFDGKLECSSADNLETAS